MSNLNVPLTTSGKYCWHGIVPLQSDPIVLSSSHRQMTTESGPRMSVIAHHHLMLLGFQFSWWYRICVIVFILCEYVANPTQESVSIWFLCLVRSLWSSQRDRDSLKQSSEEAMGDGGAGMPLIQTGCVYNSQLLHGHSHHSGGADYQMLSTIPDIGKSKWFPDIGKSRSRYLSMTTFLTIGKPI